MIGFRKTCVALLGLNMVMCQPSIAVEKTFDPIPDQVKPLYKFDLQRWFFKDEAARQADLEKLQNLTEQITKLQAEVATNPGSLLRAIELKQEMGIIADRLQAYGYLRYATNTSDSGAMDEGDQARAAFDVATQFVISVVQNLEDAALRDFMRREPRLSSYSFLLKAWRRDRPHTGPQAAEEQIARLQPHMDPFKEKYYTLLQSRTADVTITHDSRELNVLDPGQYAELMRVDDRSTREMAFQKRLAGFKSQADLYAFALYQKALLANNVAQARHFGNAIEAALFGFYLSPNAVRTVLDSFKAHASLTLRFQQAERVYQQKLLQSAQVEPWDMRARPITHPEPRYGIEDASRQVIEATKVYGPKYAAELTHLVNPHNGRLDIVPVDNRTPGDFTTGSYGPSWLFYMQGYRGHLTDVVTVAHEAAHAVHFSLLYKAGIPWYYSYGAPYFTEGFAKINELLILDQLAKEAATPSERLFYLRELNSKLASVEFASLYWSAYATSFEGAVYERLQTGGLQKPEDIHDVWGELGRLWVLNFDQHPDMKYTWAGTHHFFDLPRYYSNYLFAWVIAISAYERLQDDPGFADKLVGLMEAGFSDEPAVLLRAHLGIDLADSNTVGRIFTLIEKRLTEFEQQIEAYK